MVTLADKGGNVIIQRPEGVSLALWIADGTDIKPGHLVTANGMATPHMNKPDANTEIPYGVVVSRADGTAHEPDTALPDNCPILVAPCGSGMVVWVRALTSRGALLPGDFLTTNPTGGGKVGGTVAAKITMSTVTLEIKKFLYRNIGRAADYDADVAASDLVPVRLCH